MSNILNYDAFDAITTTSFRANILFDELIPHLG